MNAVEIDVSKGKSMVAVLRPMGEVAIMPFEVPHDDVRWSCFGLTMVPSADSQFVLRSLVF